MQNILQRNLYFTCCLFALIGGIFSYLYFFNREVLSGNPNQVKSQEIEEEPEVVVDISGAVERPGVFTLKSGSRLADLINSAGGVTNEVSQKWLSRNINLALILKDQQKIYVPFEWEVASSPPEYELRELALKSAPPAVNNSSNNISSVASSGNIEESSSTEGGSSENNSVNLINLNTASQKDLESLPKIGEVTAKNIITSRPYTGFDDLKTKAKLSDSVIEAIKGLVTF